MVETQKHAVTDWASNGILGGMLCNGPFSTASVTITQNTGRGSQEWESPGLQPVPSHTCSMDKLLNTSISLSEKWGQ